MVAMCRRLAPRPDSQEKGHRRQTVPRFFVLLLFALLYCRTGGDGARFCRLSARRRGPSEGDEKDRRNRAHLNFLHAVYTNNI